ncbi:MAG: hypothetical protein ACFE9T_07985 [Promethearchaeota archaeon]
MVIMLKYLDKNLVHGIFNSNEFKGWLLSKRWFGDKSALSNLEFKIILNYFEIISERILLTIIDVQKPEYTKSYFLPLICYEKIQDILEPSEKDNKKSVLTLTVNTFSKKIVLDIETEQEIFTINLVEGEYCLFFWKKILFDKDISETFPSRSLDLTLYLEQFQDEKNMKKVQNLIETSLYPDRYSLSLTQLGGGNTTNTLFLLSISNNRTPDQEPFSYVLKSYKEYLESLEPTTLFVLVKNQFPNAPKIYGTIKLKGKETIGILENVPNIGNLGDIYWTELNNMINAVFQDINGDYSNLIEKSSVSRAIQENCIETLKVSNEIGKYIKKLHESLIYTEEEGYNLESVESHDYLESYTKKLKSMISELQKIMTIQTETSFFNLPKINSILFDIQDIIETLRTDFKETQIQIQPVHQDLHMEQILYNKIDDQFQFYFIDFEGDPQLRYTKKKGKFPIEKDLASFLRALSYIKFNTFLKFIEKNVIKKEKYEVPEEILYNIIFRRTARPLNKILDVILNFLNIWESKLIAIILKNLNTDYTLITYFYIERALYELNYEILFRPSKIIVPILGLKEIIDKS